MTATLVFSVAHGGFSYRYRDCLASQRSYSERLGYEYVAVTRPLAVREPALSAWLKVPLLLRSLQSGYRRVLFVDADCLIQPGAPPLDPLEEVETPILMALGRSGRLNSGVIFARCSDTSVAFFGEVMQSITQPIRAEDRAQLKYENGNIIHCARRLGGVGELDPKWNNTSDPELADYVRHFTGPMRPLHTPPPLASVVSSAIGRLAGRTRPGPQPESRPTDFRHQLDRLATAAVTRYRAFNPRPTTP